MNSGDDARAARVRGYRWVLALALLHLLLAWPGAGTRGIVAEEVQPYLERHPIVLAVDQLAPVRPYPPHDQPETARAMLAGEPLQSGWIGTGQWPVLAWQGRDRTWPVFIRGHQTALGSWWGIALAPALGGGIAGVRRSSVLLGLVLILLLVRIGRAIGLSWPHAALAGLLCVLSPGLWSLTRTGYGFELGSRVAMLAALALATGVGRDQPLDLRRGTALGLCVAAAILCRATIAVTLGPCLLIALVHPRRWPGVGRVAWPAALGLGLPLLLVGLSLWLLPFWPGTTPAADLPIAELGRRTLTAPGSLWIQLAWVTDSRVVIAALVSGEQAPSLLAIVAPGVVGLLVMVVALRRWWLGRSGDGERLFVVGALANALGGAWLYGDPMQFQLAMALEPLFALAVVEQLRSLAAARPKLGRAVLVGALLGRAATLAWVWQAESETANPMLCGSAQRELGEWLTTVDDRRVLTTDYNHAGVFEAWTDARVHPIHGWPLLGNADGDVDRLTRAYAAILDSLPICHVVFSVGANLVAGEFSDTAASMAGLERAVAARGREVRARRVVQGEVERPVFEIWQLSGCE